MTMQGGKDEEEPLSLVGDEPLGLVDAPTTAGKPGGLKTFGTAAKVDSKVEFKRSTNADGAGATRCRVFYSKIAVAPLQHLENQINTWLEHAPYEVKQVGHVIGTMEGKTQEQALIVMVWF